MRVRIIAANVFVVMYILAAVGCVTTVVVVVTMAIRRAVVPVETCWVDPRPPHDAFETFLVLDGVPNLCRRLPPKSTSVLLHVFDGTEAVSCYPLTPKDCPK